MPPAAAGAKSLSPDTKQFTDWSRGMGRTASRRRLPDNQAFTLINAQPIGPGQVQITPNPGPDIVLSGSPIVTETSVVMTIGRTGPEVERIISIHADGSITSTDPVAKTTVTVSGPGTVTTACRLTMWQDNPVLFGDPANGYFSWDGVTFNHYPITRTGIVASGTPTVTTVTPNTGGLAPGMAVQGTNIPVGTTILSVDSVSQITLTNNATGSGALTLTVGAGAPGSVRDLAVFEGRVWMLTGLRAITFTGPASYTDFAVADGAGTASVTDSVFPGQITRLLSALEQLWIIGPAAINAISNVQFTNGTPILTTFSDTNIVANVGSVLPASVNAFLRTFLFASPYGIYAVVGSTPQKLSDDLDGLFPMLDFHLGAPSAVFTLNQVFMWGVLVTYHDPKRGARPVVLCFARNAWFMIDQGPITWITGLVDPATGQQQLWATDGGNHLFQCFAGAPQTVDMIVEAQSEDDSVVVPLSFGDEGPWTGALGTGPWTGMLGTGDWVSSAEGVAWRKVESFAGQYLGVRISSQVGAGYDFQTKLWDFGAFTTRKQMTRVAVDFESAPFTITGLALEIEPMGPWTKKQTSPA